MNTLHEIHVHLPSKRKMLSAYAFRFIATDPLDETLTVSCGLQVTCNEHTFKVTKETQPNYKFLILKVLL